MTIAVGAIGVYKTESRGMRSHQFSLTTMQAFIRSRCVIPFCEWKLKATFFKKLNHEGFLSFEIKCGCTLSKKVKGK